MSDRPTTVYYIGGLGRSGSTLLDRMLGELPHMFSGGEIRELWQRGLIENRLCGCGAPLRECRFWREVGLRAFGGWDRIDATEFLAVMNSIDRHRYVPLLLAPRLWPPFARRLARAERTLSRLYAAIRDVGGGAAVVDSSKAPSYAFVLRRVPGIRLRAVHLVRDSRGVAFSWAKEVRRPDTPGRVVYMHRYDAARVGMRWLTRNWLMERLAGLGIPVVRVRYESLVSSPRPEMERILRTLNGGVAHDHLSYISDRSVVLGRGHTVMGNPMRMQMGAIDLRVDDEWRTRMHPAKRAIVGALTWPLRLRYGYQP